MQLREDRYPGKELLNDPPVFIFACFEPSGRVPSAKQADIFGYMDHGFATKAYMSPLKNEDATKMCFLEVLHGFKGKRKPTIWGGGGTLKENTPK